MSTISLQLIPIVVLGIDNKNGLSFLQEIVNSREALKPFKLHVISVADSHGQISPQKRQSYDSFAEEDGLNLSAANAKEV